MNPNLQAVLDYLSRTDFDGRQGGPSLLWAILTGLMLLALLMLLRSGFRAMVRGPLVHVDRSSRTVYRQASSEPASSTYRSTREVRDRLREQDPNPTPQT